MIRPEFFFFQSANSFDRRLVQHCFGKKFEVREMVLRVVFICLALLVAYTSAQSIQINPLSGRYSSPCRPYGAAGSGLTSRHYAHYLNNGYFFRLDLFINNPDCSGGFDIGFEHFGVLNTNISPSPSTGLITLDLGEEMKVARPVTDAGVAFLNNDCSTNVFQLNLATFFRNLTCTALHAVPFSQCPMKYTVAQKNGDNLLIGVPMSCTPEARPTDVTLNIPMTKISHFPWFGGLWQSPCWRLPETDTYIESELEIADNFFFNAGTFVYSDSSCSANSLVLKVYISAF